MEAKLGIIQTLRTLREFDGYNQLKRHNVLNIFDEEGTVRLAVLPFNNAQDALAKANQLEEDPASYNAVYVTSDNPNQLRSAYRNYFNDPVDFAQTLESSIERY